jgi:hypothetical protein
MVDEILKEVEDSKNLFLSLSGKLNAEELRCVYNDLTGINIAANNMVSAQEEIYKRTQNIRQILHSHDENKNSSTPEEQNS